MFLVEAAQVGQLLDHLGVEEAPARVVDLDVGLQNLRQAVLELLDPRVILDTRTICREWGGREGVEEGRQGEGERRE